MNVNITKSAFTIKYLFCLIIIIQIFESIRSSAQCQGADIVESQNGNCIPALVRYIVQPAFAAGTIYYWNIGDGKGFVLGGDTLLHEYTIGGSYGISVNIKQPNGNECTIKKDTGFLVLNSATSLGFYADQTLLCHVPANVHLHDSSGNTTGRDWYIDGNLFPDHSKDISVPINQPENVTVTLAVYNKGGCTQLVYKPAYVQVVNMRADFCSLLKENATHDQISATFKISFDTTGDNISSIDWDFPGGNPSSYHGYSPPAIQYADISTPHSVTLSISARNGCNMQNTKTDLVRKYYSTGKATVCQQDSAKINYLDTHAPFQVSGFNGISSNLPLTYYVGKNGSYAIKFGAPGLADIKLGIVYSSCNCTDTLLVPGLFKVLPDFSDFTSPNRNQCTTPAKVNLTALSNDSNPGANTYIWQILDSSGHQISGSPIGPLKTLDTSFTFLKDGLYSIKLITINANGCIDTMLKTNFSRIGIPDNDFVLLYDTICIGSTLSITNLTTSVDDPNNPLGYDWAFQLERDPSVRVTSSVRSPSFTFESPGMYDLSYTITSYLKLCPSTRIIKQAVFVQGAEFTIGISGKDGCAPISKVFTATITENFPNSPLTYFWTVEPSDGVVIQDPTSLSTSIYFSLSGCYSITFITTDQRKCSSKKTSYNMVCIGTHAIFSAPTITCLNTPVSISNNSGLSPDQFKWTVSPSSGIVFGGETDNVPSLKITSPGCYTIKLQTSKSSVAGCYDTVSHRVCAFARPTITSLYSPDTSSRCAPRYDQFFASAVNAATFFWDYGDGTTIVTADSQPKHAYFKNNNIGYTVKLLAYDKNGCPSDTLILIHYIKIKGPEPDFRVSSQPPCGSATVQFSNYSTFVSRYYFLYGDLSGVDSNQINPHFYRFLDYSIDSNVFLPQIFAYDESGCVATEQQQVVLHRPPLIQVSVDTSAGCVPLHVQWQNNTQYATKYVWDFGDGTVDSTVQPGHTFTKASPQGSPYKINLEAIAPNGCTSSASEGLVTVYPLPILGIRALTLQPACYQDTIHFAGTSDLPLSQYQWDFGDGDLKNDTSSFINPSYHYFYSGRHTVSLTGTSMNGCKATLTDTSTINILDTLPPPVPEICFVTVTAAQGIEIVYRKQTSIRFGSNSVYRFPPLSLLYRTVSNQDTVVQDLPPQVNVNQQSYTYTMASTDRCVLTSLLARPHSTIFLRVKSTGNQAILLNWNKYVGWDSVSRYEIYRQKNNSPLLLYSNVGASDSSFLDSVLCPGMYSYYIKAVCQGHPYFSNSNIAQDSPVYIYPTAPVYVIRATVVDNKEIEVDWAPNGQPNIGNYHIARSIGYSDWQNDYAETDTPVFMDNNTDVNQYSYHYRIRVADHCGFIGPWSNIGTSVLLKGTINNDNRVLDWTSYQLWLKGVQNYHVQLQQPDGSVQDIGTPTDTVFTDSNAHAELGDFPACYTVNAQQNPNGLNIMGNSLSNKVCLNLPARLFIPDAFTPNKDNTNDLFKPVGLSILNGDNAGDLKYDFQIYNRWGELVYETHDVTQGWDGRFKGQDAPMDVYVYIIEAHGLKYENFYMHGTVTLLK